MIAQRLVLLSLFLNLLSKFIEIIQYKRGLCSMLSQCTHAFHNEAEIESVKNKNKIEISSN